MLGARARSHGVIENLPPKCHGARSHNWLNSWPPASEVLPPWGAGSTSRRQPPGQRPRHNARGLAEVVIGADRCRVSREAVMRET